MSVLHVLATGALLQYLGFSIDDNPEWAKADAKHCFTSVVS